MRQHHSDVIEQLINLCGHHPHLRVGQLIVNAITGQKCHLFYLEDEKLVELLKDYPAKGNPDSNGDIEWQLVLMTDRAETAEKAADTWKKKYKFMLKMKDVFELSRPLCPDCRDKCRNEFCLRCQIQMLTRQRNQANERLRLHNLSQVSDFELSNGS